MWEQNLRADRRPAKPAAVRTYDAAGDTRCVVFDLDCKKPGNRATVLRDCDRLSAWLGEAGCAFFVDESPSGGRHVYVPLDHARSQSEIAPLLKGLRASGALPTLDAGPMVNLTEGCIRPPGAEHRLGGFQRLVTPLNQAAATLVHRTTPAAWEALLTQLPTAEVTRVDVVRLLEAVPAAAELAIAATGGPARPLAPYFTTIAVTGQYDTDRYGSPSQARAAVVLHAVGRGWTGLELRRELDAGHWPAWRRSTATSTAPATPTPPCSVEASTSRATSAELSTSSTNTHCIDHSLALRDHGGGPRIRSTFTYGNGPRR